MGKALVLLVLVFALSENSSAASDGGSNWQIRDPGFKALNIAGESDTALWVCGSNASIAISRDGGMSWQIRDQTRDAGLFLNIGFRGSFGYAAGTTGFIAFTNDSGQTWQHTAIPYRDVLSISFSDSTHGLVRTTRGVFVTLDGKTWTNIVDSQPKEFDKFPFVLGVAALDSKYMAVHLSEPPPSASGFLVTKDGGATWGFVQIPNSTITTLLIQGDKYWAVGTEVIHKDKPSGGYAVPLAVYSSDGEKWEHSQNDIQMCHWEGCGGRCTNQGCLAASSLVLSIFQKNPERIVFPPNPGLTTKWATSQSTICFVGQDVECAKTQTDPNADASKMSGTAPVADAQPLAKMTQNNGVQCLSCGLQSVYVDDKANGAYKLRATLMIDANGLVKGFDIQNAPSPSLEQKIKQSVMQWVFVPTLQNGVPVNVKLNTVLNVMAVKSR